MTFLISRAIPVIFSSILMLGAVGTLQFPKKITPTGILLLVTLPAAVHQFKIGFVRD